LAAAPRRDRPVRWRMRAVRGALAVVAVAQLAVGVPELVGQDHVGHEVASWNTAAGIGFLCVVWRPARVSGVLPVVLAALAVLSAITLRDVLSGHAVGGREASHLLLVAGVLLLAAMGRGGGETPGRTPLRGPGPAQRGELGRHAA
jgi:predicted anti-sigma-YlaC factor YlaD